MEKKMKSEILYDYINGFINSDMVSMPIGIEIYDEFVIGSECYRLTEQIYCARIRLAEKLNKEEDEDLEIIINNMNAIAKHLAIKMFEYGKEIALVTKK